MQALTTKLTMQRQRLASAASNLALAPVAWALSHGMALAQAAPGGGGGGGANADVTGALDTNQEALTAVETSTFTAEGVGDAAQGSTNAVLMVAGFLGICMAAWGIYKLWKISNEGDQARDSALQPILMTCIGGLMTIASVVTAIFPNLFLGA